MAYLKSFSGQATPMVCEGCGRKRRLGFHGSMIGFFCASCLGVNTPAQRAEALQVIRGRARAA